MNTPARAAKAEASDSAADVAYESAIRSAYHEARAAYHAAEAAYHAARAVKS